MAEISEPNQVVLPSAEALVAEVEMHRMVLQGMALDLRQLRAQQSEIANLLDFVVESLSEAAPKAQPEEPSNVAGA